MLLQYPIHGALTNPISLSIRVYTTGIILLVTKGSYGPEIPHNWAHSIGCHLLVVMVNPQIQV